jgi:hypothetical protein
MHLRYRYGPLTWYYQSRGAASAIAFYCCYPLTKLGNIRAEVQNLCDYVVLHFGTTIFRKLLVFYLDLFSPHNLIQFFSK